MDTQSEFRVPCTSQEVETFVAERVQLVRTGRFTELIENEPEFDFLTKLAQEPQRGYVQAQCAAIVAETNDQVSRYVDARKYANRDIGDKQLGQLEDHLRQPNPSRTVVRAHAWLLLQCAVSEFRSENGQSDALRLLERGISLITRNRGAAIGSQHIQSLFHFWKGRIYSAALYKFPDSDLDFEAALRVADETLNEKLQDAAQRGDENLRNIHIAAGTYVLSTIFSFGLGQARQLQSKLRDSIWFLRAAVPLSRGSRDLHRRGFAHLLMGTALRGVARYKDDPRMVAADDELELAKGLLDHRSYPHRLHLARVHHQIALSRFNRIPHGRAAETEFKMYLEHALSNNVRAKELSEDPLYDGFHDPLLDYGIAVVSSLIETARGNYDVGSANADEALAKIGSNFPGGPRTRGWGLVAKGIAFADQVTRPDQQAEIEKAVETLGSVATDEDMRDVDRAAAYLHLARLYSRIGQHFKAEHHRGLAAPLVDKSEHGWIKDLESETRTYLKGDSGSELHVNVDDLLQQGSGSEKGAWKHIIDFVESDLKQRLLAVPRFQRLLTEPDGEAKVAKELGISRATLFLWKKDHAIKWLFPVQGRRGRPKGK